MHNSIAFKGRAYKNDIRSAFLTAILFGMISPNMSSTTVPDMVATNIAKGLSSINLTARTVIIAVKATLTRLFPRSIVDNSRSMFETMSATRLAPGTFVFTR
jgi:hypothetical protein